MWSIPRGREGLFYSNKPDWQLEGRPESSSWHHQLYLQSRKYSQYSGCSVVSPYSASSTPHPHPHPPVLVNFKVYITSISTPPIDFVGSLYFLFMPLIGNQIHGLGCSLSWTLYFSLYFTFWRKKSYRWKTTTLYLINKMILGLIACIFVNRWALTDICFCCIQCWDILHEDCDDWP